MQGGAVRVRVGGSARTPREHSHVGDKWKQMSGDGPRILDSVTSSLCGQPRPAHLTVSSGSFRPHRPSPVFCPSSPPSPPPLARICSWHSSFQPEMGFSPAHGVPNPGARAQVWLVWKEEASGGVRLGLLPAQAKRAGSTQRRTKAIGKEAGGGGRAVGRPQGAPGTCHGQSVPMPGPCGAHPGLGAVQRWQACGGPHGWLHPLTQSRLGLPREVSGDLWVSGGPPGRCEPWGALDTVRAFLSLSFFICTMGLISQSWGPDSQAYGCKRGASDGPSGGQTRGGSQMPLAQCLRRARHTAGINSRAARAFVEASLGTVARGLLFTRSA